MMSSNDGLQLSTLVEEETRDVTMDLLNHTEDHVTSVQRIGKILPTVEVDGHSIYKSTLLSQLNGNFFYPKIDQHELNILFDSTTMIIVSKQDLHVDQVCNLQDLIMGCILSNRAQQKLLSTVKSAAKRKNGRSKTTVKVENATNILNRVDFSSWQVGRVQAMRRHNRKRFGILRQVVDLLAQTKESRRRTNNLHIVVMLQYYRKHPCHNKYKYDHTYSKWIDVDALYLRLT